MDNTYNPSLHEEQIKQRQAQQEVAQLCRESDWEAVLDRVISQPALATARLLMDNHIATTLLHKTITSKGDTRLRSKVVTTVLRQTPHAARLTNGYGSLPLHVIAQRNTKMDSATKEALMNQLIQAYPDAVLKAGGVGKRTPLHVIFTDYVSPRLTKTVIENGTQACFMPDKRGFLPAHVACSRHCSPEKLRMLLEVNPQALFHRTKEGCTLLDLAKTTATKAHPNFALIKELERQLALFGMQSPTDELNDAFADKDVSLVQQEADWTPSTIQDAAFATFGAAEDITNGFPCEHPFVQKHGPTQDDQHLHFGLDQGPQNYQHQQPFQGSPCVEQPRPLQPMSHSGSDQVTHPNYYHQHQSQYKHNSQMSNESDQYEKDDNCVNHHLYPSQQIHCLDPSQTPSPRVQFEPDYLDDRSFAAHATRPTYYGNSPQPMHYTAPEPLYQPSFDYQHGTSIESDARPQNVFRKPHYNSAQESIYPHELQADYGHEGQRQHTMEQDQECHFNVAEPIDCLQQQHPQDHYQSNEPHTSHLQKYHKEMPELQNFQKDLQDRSKLHPEEQYPAIEPHTPHLQIFHKELPDSSFQQRQPQVQRAYNDPHASHFQKYEKELPDHPFQEPQAQIGFKRTPTTTGNSGRYVEPLLSCTDGHDASTNTVQHHQKEPPNSVVKQDPILPNEPTKNPDRASLNQVGDDPLLAPKLQPDNYYAPLNGRDFFESVDDIAQTPQASVEKKGSKVGQQSRKRKVVDSVQRPDAKKAATVDPAVDLLMNFSRASAHATHDAATKRDVDGF